MGALEILFIIIIIDSRLEHTNSNHVSYCKNSGSLASSGLHSFKSGTGKGQAAKLSPIQSRLLSPIQSRLLSRIQLICLQSPCCQSTATENPELTAWNDGGGGGVNQQEVMVAAEADWQGGVEQN